MVNHAASFESLVFYRGMSDSYPIDRPFVVTPRQDRRPKNSSQSFHELADKWFESRFGIPYRSQGVFVTARFLTAAAYAASHDYVMRVIPISPYNYCWSQSVSDLLFAATKLADATSKDVNAFLSNANYLDDDLKAAHTSGHEVMLSCMRYIAVPNGLLGAPSNKEQSSIILNY